MDFGDFAGPAAESLAGSIETGQQARAAVSLEALKQTMINLRERSLAKYKQGLDVKTAQEKAKIARETPQYTMTDYGPMDVHGGTFKPLPEGGYAAAARRKGKIPLPDGGTTTYADVDRAYRRDFNIPSDAELFNMDMTNPEAAQRYRDEATNLPTFGEYLKAVEEGGFVGAKDRVMASRPRDTTPSQPQPTQASNKPGWIDWIKGLFHSSKEPPLPAAQASDQMLSEHQAQPQAQGGKDYSYLWNGGQPGQAPASQGLIEAQRPVQAPPPPAQPGTPGGEGFPQPSAVTHALPEQPTPQGEPLQPQPGALPRGPSRPAGGGVAQPEAAIPQTDWERRQLLDSIDQAISEGRMSGQDIMKWITQIRAMLADTGSAAALDERQRARAERLLQFLHAK